MLMWPSLVWKTPVGMPVGWSLPACFATSPSISQREAWKSSMKICASSSEVCTHWPSPDCSRSSSADKDALRAEDAGAEVGDRDADAHRALAGQAGDRHQAAHALRDLVEAGPLRVGPVLAEAGDAAVDDARVDLRPASRSRCRGGTSRRGGNSRRSRRPSATSFLRIAMPSARLQVERDASACCGAGSGSRSRRAAAERRRRRHALGHLDLDHVGAPVGELAHRRSGRRARA